MMKKTTALTAALTLLLPLFVILARAQQQSPSASKPPAQKPETASDRDDVVRITTSLVQIDAIVTKGGRQVTDLTVADFEIFEDGRPQKITNFSYVSNESGVRTDAPLGTANPRKGADKLAPPDPPRRLRPEQIRRTMALVVDDLSLSSETTESAQYALRRFVSEQMQPDDLVAIVRTSAGIGALQQFTSDKRQLNAAIDRVKWYPVRGRVSAFDPMRAGDSNSSIRPDSLLKARGTNDRDSEAELNEFREDLFAEGTIGALNFVVRGMRDLPGRKSVVLLSHGFLLPQFNRGGRSGHDRVGERLRQLTDLANRTAVVFYAVDIRGLAYTGITAADDVSGLTPADRDMRLDARERELLDTQSGMDYLSRQTGGFLMKNSNDIPGLIKRVVEDQKGYYLIGYPPESTTFDRRFHQIKVKVKRPDLRVRSRSGFYGIGNEERRALPSTRNQQLYTALISPFATPGVDLRLATFFTNTVQEGSFMRSLMYIDGHDLTFTKQPDGMYQTTLDVIGVSFDGSGRLIDSSDRIQTLNLKEETYRKALSDGLIYFFNVQIKKPGAYQLRMAVRDTASERTGSASQFIQVPDLKKNRLVLSGLIVNGLISAGASNETAVAPAGDVQLVASGPNPFTSTTVRRFRQNSTLAFGYVIYNARIDKTNLPQLTAQTRIFRDNKPIYVGSAMPINATGQPDLKRINIGTQLQLGNKLPPGEYVLQVIITDTLANEKYGTTTQWIDFEIVK